jgi:hypothetical protein
MRRLGIGAALLLLAACVFLFLRGRAPRALEEAVVGERRVTLWNRVAQVREPVGMARYGDRVAILERKEPHVRVRTADGREGWVEQKQLFEADVWRLAQQLRAEARERIVQARGRTRVLANVRGAPGRTGTRIYQFGRDVNVEVLARAVAEAPPAEEPAAKPAGPGDTSPRREDWLFVRGATDEAGEVAGWVLGRFIELDLPEALREYAVQMRIVGWFELNRVASDGERPQYLAVGTKGPGGQPCDFTQIRVFTWNLQRPRYETAYVESNLCGRLPVRVEPGPRETVFRFVAVGATGEEPREYRFRQNIVRRIRAR